MAQYLPKSLPSDKLFFTGDTHFGHNNIIKYCNRPFTGAADMDDQLVKRWNDVVPDKGATVIHVGDVFFCSASRAEEILVQLNYDKLFWIPGNHDKTAYQVSASIQPVGRQPFIKLPPLVEIRVDDHGTEQLIIGCHYALRTWDRAHHGSWHVYGHSHSGLKNDMGDLMQDYEYTLSMDVGVDCNNYQPFTYEQVKQHMATKKFRPSDHHSAKMQPDDSSGTRLSL